MSKHNNDDLAKIQVYMPAQRAMDYRVRAKKMNISVSALINTLLDHTEAHEALFNAQLRLLSDQKMSVDYVKKTNQAYAKMINDNMAAMMSIVANIKDPQEAGKALDRTKIEFDQKINELNKEKMLETYDDTVDYFERFGFEI